MPPYVVSKTGPTEIEEEATRDECCQYVEDLVEEGTLDENRGILSACTLFEDKSELILSSDECV